MTQKALPALFLIGGHARPFRPAEHLVQYIPEHLRLQQAVPLLDNPMAAGGVKAGQKTVIPLGHRILGLVAVSVGGGGAHDGAGRQLQAADPL